MDETAFRSTQDTASHPRLNARYEKIMNNFGIDWPSVEWTDLRILLYSGLAARLFLLNMPMALPCDIAGQAAYWKLHYNTPAGRGTVQKFITDIEALNSVEGIMQNDGA